MSTSHARKQIRDAVVALLQKGKENNWNQVIPDRVLADRALWPYCMVYSSTDSMDPDIVRPATQLRDLSLVVAWINKLPGNHDKSTIEDQMDAAAADIETRLTGAALNAVGVLPLVKEFTLVSTDLSVVEVDEEPDYGELTMIWRVIYATNEGQPSTLI